MNILHIAPLSFRKSTGFTTSIPNLVINQNKNDSVDVKIVNVSKDIKNKKEEQNLKAKVDYNKFINLSTEDIIKSKPDIIVFHSLYLYKYIKISKELIKQEIPYVIVPRGSMTDQAQNKKKVKKLFGNLIFFNKFINNASAIHFLSEGERNNSIKWDVNNFVIGNGMSLPDIKSMNRSKDKELIFSFIARKDVFHKGLDILLEGIKLKLNILSNLDIQINLYGPDHEGDSVKVDNLIKKYGLENIVNNLDGVFGKEKHEVLLNTDLFLLTSRFEGHPMSVLEAMAYKIPCLLTPGTNMAEVTKQYNAGWVAESSPESIAEKINEIIENRSKLPEYGENARGLVREEFTWGNIAEKTIKEYRKLV